MNINLEKWSHRAAPFLIAAVILASPLILLPDNWWGRLINTVSLLPLGALLVLNLIHGNGFCEYCAAATPADALGAARRKSRTLKFYHRCLGITGWLYLAALLLVPSLLPLVWPHAIAWAAFQPAFLYFMWASRVHRLLEPWCPWCNNGDGGLREPSPDPVIPQKV